MTKLTVYDNKPIYNVPIYSDTIITGKNPTSSETIDLNFTSQYDYVTHSEINKQEMFISGKSMFDTTVYSKEYQRVCYAKWNKNYVECEVLQMNQLIIFREVFSLVGLISNQS